MPLILSITESFLKKREGGQTIQEDRAQDKRGQGQGHDPCRDVPENPLADLTRYNEVNHWMHFLCNLRSKDPSEAFAGKLACSTLYIKEESIYSHLTSVLHEHVTLKLVQCSILLFKLVFLVRRHIHATSKRPTTKNASSEGTICTFVLEYNQHKPGMLVTICQNIY